MPCTVFTKQLTPRIKAFTKRYLKQKKFIIRILHTIKSKKVQKNANKGYEEVN
jgi:hypothetical protein